MPRLIAVFFLITLVHPAMALPQARDTQPQRGQPAASAKPPSPMTLRQVLESLSSSRSSTRVENLISKAGVQFRATPEVIDILKQFGAGPKLISLIPAPPPPAEPPTPPAPKTAGPLTVVCQPKDCAVVIDDKFEGSTEQNHKTISGLRLGESTVQIFADGYEHLTRKVVLVEGKSSEEDFSLKRTATSREESGRALLLKTLATLGGADGFVEFSNLEGAGKMDWINSSGGNEQWTMTFKKGRGRDLATTFKTVDGQCSATILAQTSKQDCRAGLKNGGDKIALQGTSLFLSYQLQDVIHALLSRPLILSETDDNRVESVDTKDTYVLTIGDRGFPKELVYRVGNGDPVHVEYSDYLKVDDGWYPGRISMGRPNAAPSWVFTLNSVHSRVGRAQ
jgi:hypothetical protein